MARRGHGEGSFHRRDDGRLEFKMSAGYRGSKRVRPSILQRKGETDTDFRKRARDLQRHQDAGLPFTADERLTVGAYLNRWYDAVVVHKRPKTQRQYRYIIDSHLSELARTRLKDLTPDAVQVMLNDRALRLSPNTVHRIRAVLRASLTQAIRWGYVSRNVASGVYVDVPELRLVNEVEPLTVEQARTLHAHWREDRLGALYSLTMYCGLRQGEALALRWSDIDLDAGTLVVQRQLTGKTKTRESVRRIHMPPSIVSMMREYRASRDVLALSGLVFLSTRNEPLDGTSVTHALQKFVASLGLPRITYHALRHTAATLMLSEGVHPKLAADYLGHEDEVEFMRTYAHVLPRMTASVATMMERAISG